MTYSPINEFQARIDADCDARGYDETRRLVDLGFIAEAKKLAFTKAWLRRQDEARQAASDALIEARRAEAHSLQARTADATEAAAAAALDSASSARTANEIARSANALASDANTIALRAVRRARDANKIAIGAAIIAVIAIGASLLKGG